MRHKEAVHVRMARRGDSPPSHAQQRLRGTIQVNRLSEQRTACRYAYLHRVFFIEFAARGTRIGDRGLFASDGDKRIPAPR